MSFFTSHKTLMKRMRKIQPQDEVLAEVWHAITHMIDRRRLNIGTVRHIIENRLDRGYDEFNIEFEGDVAVVFFVNQEFRCDAQAILDLLDKAEGPIDPKEAPSGDELASQLGSLFGVELHEFLGADLDPFLISVGHLVEELLADDEEARQAAQVRAKQLAAQLQKRGVDGAEQLSRLPEQLGVAREQLDPSLLAGHLRTLADWLEGRSAEAGSKVDALIEALDSGLGAVLGTTAAQKAEQAQRIQSNARASIAGALKSLGLKVK